MNILLVNPNRYKSPPVPPVGLEYLAASLEEKGHKTEIIDLCFSEDIYNGIDCAIQSFNPDIAGITVRNIDTVLYHTNEFFLDEIKDIVHHIKSKHGLKVIIGGTGIMANPEGVLEYLAADAGIAGPSENTILEVLNDLNHKENKKKIYYGEYARANSCTARHTEIDYKKYHDAGGIIGFETHKGCSSSCTYCLESRSRVVFKNIKDIIREMERFVDMGYSHFHLCDSEFNEDLEYAIEFCTALIQAGLNVRWAVYMKPTNFNKKLFNLLKKAGVYLITLSVDSWKKSDYYWEEIKNFIISAKLSEIKVAVDFLTGFPYEHEDLIRQYLDLLRRPLPDSVGVNTYIRLYRSLPITSIILHDRQLQDYLLGNTDDHTFIRPVFYNHISTEKLAQLIDSDPLFRIEGLEKGVNYSRVGAKL